MLVKNGCWSDVRHLVSFFWASFVGVLLLVSLSGCEGAGNEQREPRKVTDVGIDEDVVTRGDAVEAPTDMSKLEKDGESDSDTTPIGNEKTPVLSDFSISDSNRDRIYFSSSKSIEGMSISNFRVSGKTINSLSINGTQTTGHYFTVSSDFTFWDNNTIRLGENDDTAHGQEILHNFTLRHIINNIPEPIFSGTEYFVDGSVDNSGNGLSEAAAFKSIQEAVDTLSGGDKVWIKAFSGFYAPASLSAVSQAPSGEATRFEGYKMSNAGVPIPITSNYYTPFDDLNSTALNPLDELEMPLIDGGDRSRGTGFEINGTAGRGTIIKNIQIQNCATGFGRYNIGELYNVVVENCNTVNIGSTTTDDRGNGFSFATPYRKSGFRFTNCIAVNSTHANFWMRGDHSMIDGCQSYCNESGAGGQSLETDYYILGNGFDNIIKNSTAVKKIADGFGGHGIQFKYEGEHNLAEGNLAVNLAGSLISRRKKSKYNVFRGNEAHGDVPYKQRYVGGVGATHSAGYNVFESNYIHHADGGMGNNAGSEGQNESHFQPNFYRNNIIENVANAISIRNTNATLAANYGGGTYYHNTIVNCVNLFKIDGGRSGLTLSKNLFKNNLVSSVTSYYDGSETAVDGFVLDYNHFFDGFPDEGTNTTTTDPQFYDLINYVPQATDIGAPVLFGVERDYRNKERAIPNTTRGAQTTIKE